MNTTKTNNLSFYNDQGILTLTAKQFDTGRLFVFHIMDNDTPLDLSGCTAYLRIAKADGTQFQGHECCTVECSKVIINTSVGNGNQILTAAGINVCELHLKDANDIALTTWTFHIVVEPRVHDGSHMSSIDSYDVLDNMINMEKERIANEKQRKENEENRKAAFEQKIGETNTVITECRLVIDTANQKINSFDEEINEIVDGITDEAQSYANNAKVSETNAANAASGAADSANTASQKASDAAASATLSQSYAVGGTGLRTGEDSDNAKEYARQAKAITDELQEKCILKTEKGAAGGVATLGENGKIPKGQLPDDIGSVTGIKGDKESTYRAGNVNLTPENIGAVNKSGDTISGNLYINHDLTVLGNLNGQTNSTAHSIILGHNQKDHCDFYEYGGVYNFYKGSESGSKTLLGKITNNGWEGNASTASKLGSLNIGGPSKPVYFSGGVPHTCYKMFNLYTESYSTNREAMQYFLFRTEGAGGYDYAYQQFISFRPTSAYGTITLPYSVPYRSYREPVIFTTLITGESVKNQMLSVCLQKYNNIYTRARWQLYANDNYIPIYNEHITRVNIMIMWED